MRSRFSAPECATALSADDSDGLDFPAPAAATVGISRAGGWGGEVAAAGGCSRGQAHGAGRSAGRRALSRLTRLITRRFTLAIFFGDIRHSQSVCEFFR